MVATQWIQQLVPTKKPRITFVADDELKRELEAWADEESRTVSNLCELIIRKAVEARKAQQEQQDK